ARHGCSPKTCPKRCRIPSAAFLRAKFLSLPLGKRRWNTWRTERSALSNRLLLRRRRRRRHRRRSRLRRGGRAASQHRPATHAGPRRVHRKSDGRKHEDDRGPGCGLGQHGGGGARAKSGLAAHAAKGRGNVGALATLQQNYGDEKRTNDDMNNGNQNDHVALNSRFRRLRLKAHAPPAMSLISIVTSTWVRYGAEGGT